MFIELLDGLRCVSDHEKIALVTAISKRDDRFVMEGIIGCPICRREYPVRNGIAFFGAMRSAPDGTSHAAAGDDDGAMRIGAFLGVADGVTIALVGEWAQYAPELASAVGLRAFAVNPKSPIEESDRVGIVYSDNLLPFSDGSLRGVAIDDSDWSDADVQLATRALSAGGRMVAPASIRVPEDVEEVVRDETLWIGEKRGPLVALHRR
jgi:uncharacterized protein YbaR (Trm112 family)